MNATTEKASTDTAAELVKPKEVIVAERQALAAIQAASSLVIDSREGYEAAGEELQSLRDRYRAIEAQRVHLKEPFLEGGRRIDAFFRVPLDRLKEAGESVSRSMLKFDQAEQERIRKQREEAEAQERARQQELQRQQQELDRKEREAREAREKAEREAQAEKDRVEREAQAERERIEAQARAEREEAERAGNAAAAEEAEKKAAAARAEADERARLAKVEADRIAEENRLAAEAADAEAQRQAQQLQDSIDLAAVTPTALVSTSEAKASGVSTRRTWKAASIDLRALVLGVAKAIEEGSERADELLSYLQANESALNATAKGLKGAARVPGVVFGEVANLATRSAGKSRAGG